MGGPAGGGRRKQQAADTRELLLDAARTVFDERGYTATTVGAITERANTAHGTFYLYFKNKEDVFGQVITGIAAELYERAVVGNVTVDPTRSAETTEAAVAALLAVYTDHSGSWRGLYEAALQSSAIRRIWLDLRHAFVERLVERFDELRAAGVAHDLDPVVTAFGLVAMVEFFAFTRAVFDEPTEAQVSEARAVRELATLWNRAVLKS